MVQRDMDKLHDFIVPILIDPSSLSRGSNATALEYFMFLEMKRDGTIKGRGCAYRRKKRSYTPKE